MQETKLENLQLRDIVASPTNPRKIFDQHKTEELAASIREQGVIAPILVRPLGKRYEIVYGERRYRASKLAGNATIPATIRELSDQQVREMQLVENFQREDIHPMEEAVAIFAAIKTGQYTIEDLALKVGKTARYIAQRNKLNDLIAEFQEKFFDGKINLKEALQLVTISEKDQKDYFKKCNQPHGFYLNNLQYSINQYQGRLDRAPFSLDDATLNPEMGSCTKCPLNSSNANLLFPDNSKDPVCMNSQCFAVKNKAHFSRSLKEAAANPSIVTISESYSLDNTAKALAEKENITVLPASKYEIMEEPELEELDRDDYETTAEFNTAKKQALKTFNEEMDEYTKGIKRGKFKKAFVVEGPNAGNFIYVSLEKEVQESLVPKSDDNNLDDIDEEIKRIEKVNEEKFNKEDRSLMQEINELVTPAILMTTAKDWTAALSQQEWSALALALLQCSDNEYEFEEWAASVIGIENTFVRTVDLPKFKEIDQQQINHLLRILIITVLTGHDSTKNPHSQLLLPILKSKNLLQDKIEAIEKKYVDAAFKRVTLYNTERAKLNDERIRVLEKNASKKKAKKEAVL